jgi:hypothetical protein
VHRLGDDEAEVVGESVLEPPAPVRGGIGMAKGRLHPHVALAQLDRTGRDVVRPQVEGAAAVDVEPRVVPMAGQDAVLDAAAVEREAHVRATIVESEHAPAVVDDEDRTMAAVQDEPALGLQFLEAPGQREVRVRRVHRRPPAAGAWPAVAVVVHPRYSAFPARWAPVRRRTCDKSNRIWAHPDAAWPGRVQACSRAQRRARRKIVSEMTIDIHALMQDAHDLDHIGSRRPIEEEMRADRELEIAGSDILDAAALDCPTGEAVESIADQPDIAIRLGFTPARGGVRPDPGEVAPGRSGKSDLH